MVSLLQYMKNTDLRNPDIIIKDSRIETLDQIVTEIKQSEEWKAVQMSILEVGIRKGHEEGRAAGLEEGIKALILDNLEEDISPERIITKLQKRFDLSAEQAKEYFF